MNLHDCRIVYFPVPIAVLTVIGRTAVLAALQVYRDQDTWSLSNDAQSSRYRSRKLSEVRWELQRRNLVSESLKLPEIPPKDRVLLPTKLDYEGLSIGELKSLIACYARCRYSHEAFRFVCTQELLAKQAELSPRHLSQALQRLQIKRLIDKKKLWREGTQITMLDPETRSGCSLYDLGQWYAQQLDTVPVHDRYKVCLSRNDPRGYLEKIREPVHNYQIVCPLCTHPDPKGTMRINTSEEEDSWFCHKCKRSGNSARLWAKLQWGIGKEKDWTSLLGATVPSVSGTGMEVRA